MSKKTKAFLMTVCAIILVVTTVAGTTAYLTAQTAKVANTFTAGEGLFKEPDAPQTPAPDNPKAVNGLYLYEKTATAGADGTYTLGTPYCTENRYTVLPGMTIPKDPTVYVVGKSSTAAYLYIEVVDGLDNTDKILTYGIDSANWTKLQDVTGPYGGTVYVYSGGQVTTDVNVAILANNSITVSADATEEQIKTAMNEKSIVFYAYMAQCATFADATAAYNACFPAK